MFTAALVILVEMLVIRRLDPLRADIGQLALSSIPESSDCGKGILTSGAKSDFPVAGFAAIQCITALHSKGIVDILAPKYAIIGIFN
jgi:hypothetical protein